MSALKQPPTTVWITGDQLTPQHSALADVTPDTGVVLMVESWARARQLPYHKQKVALMWSAMRHFAAELRSQGYTVDYYEAQPNFQNADPVTSGHDQSDVAQRGTPVNMGRVHVYNQGLAHTFDVSTVIYTVYVLIITPSQFPRCGTVAPGLFQEYSDSKYKHNIDNI